MSGSLARFDIDPKTGALVDPSEPTKAPDQVQGVAVVDGGEGLLFSTNHEPDKLVYQPITATPARSPLPRTIARSWTGGSKTADSSAARSKRSTSSAKSYG